MKRMTKRMLAFCLCLLVLPVDGLAARAEDKAAEPPRYMRQLSRMVAAAGENSFGEIRLTVGAPEMDMDGESRPIADGETVVPYVDEDGVLQIPASVLEEADAAGSYLSEDALQAQGYDVAFDADDGTIRITEPFGLCRLIVRTRDGKVGNTYGAVQTLAVSDNQTVLQYADKDAAAFAAEQFERDETILSWYADFVVTAAAVSAQSGCWGTARAGADAFTQSLDTADAEEVVVAVIDTGVDAQHPFLQGRVLEGGWDFVNDDADPADDASHGTHCAGIIRDATPDNVKILPIKILNASGRGSASVIEEAIRYAADRGAQVLNMSFGGSDKAGRFWRNSTNGVRYAGEKGAVCVAAAGNTGSCLDTNPIYPANVPQAFTVACTDEQDCVSAFSNYGTNVDIAAPGEDVLSCVPGGKYYKYSGTSEAAPLVAACAALLKTQDGSRTPDEIEAILCERAKDRGVRGRDDRYGAGVVWLGGAVPAERMSFAAENCTMYVRELRRIAPVFAPEFPSDMTVTYESADPTVVEVRGTDGCLKALQPGTAAVTATAADGKTACVQITVLPAQPLTQCIPCSDSGLIFLQPDGTATCFGSSVFGELGYSYSSSTGTFFPFDKNAGDEETDIAQMWCATYGDGATYYTKTDGTVYRSGAGLLDGISCLLPHKLFKEDGSALTDVCAVSPDGFLLRGDGTVWLPTDENSHVFRMLYKEDGTPLMNVVSLDGVFFARCADGTCWTWVQGDYIDSYDAMTARPLCDRDQTLLADVRQACVFGMKLSDEAGAASGTQTDYSYCPEYVTFRKTDGSVWAFGANRNGQLASSLSDSASPVPVCTAQDTPLTDVVKLLDCAALRADGTLWVWGGAEGGDYNGWMGIGPYNGKTKGFARQPMIDAATPLDDVRDFWLCGRLVVLRADNSLWWSDAESGYMTPMVLDGETMYLQPDGTALLKRSVAAVSLDVTQRTLQVSESFALHAAVTPADAAMPDVFWRSSDPDVAFADGAGTVYARKAGTAVISAVSQENETICARCTVRVEDSALCGMELAALPDKTLYHTGEAPDVSGGLLQLRYADGHIRRVPFSAADCAGFDAHASGTQTVSVTYGGCTAAFDVTVSDAAVCAISMQTLPDKTEYYPHETFRPDGASIRAEYADGSSTVLPLTEDMYTQPDLSQTGTCVTDVRYGGASCSFSVAVAQPEVVRIAPQGTLPPLTQGETVDLADVQIRVFYADGSENTVAVTQSMCAFCAETPGLQQMTVTYAGCETTFALYVEAPERAVAAIFMHSLPHVLYYHDLSAVFSAYSDKIGYPVCTDGGSISVEYADGGTQILPLQKYMCGRIAKPTSAEPTRTVTVTYGGCTAAFDVFYDAMSEAASGGVTSLEVTKAPEKTTFWIGDPITTEDMRDRFADGRVCLTWADGTQKEFCMTDQGISVSLQNDADRLTSGEKTVSVCFGSVADSFTVQYLDPTESAVIYECYFISTPYKTAYAVGETLDVTGGRIGVTRSTDLLYDNGGNSCQEIDVTEEMCAGYDLSVPGVQTVTVDAPLAQLFYTITVFTITAENLQPQIEAGQVTCIQTDFVPYVAQTPQIVWTSSDETVATVDETGRVTGVAPGEAQITAHIEGSGASAVCAVTVTEHTTARLPGDADLDGEVGLTDVVQITRYLAGGWDAVIDLVNADVNADGSVDLRDAVLIRRFLAGGWNVVLV